MPSSSRKPATDWRTLVLDAVDADKPKIITTGVRFDAPSDRVIRKAAKKRGMSPAAFIRRAAVAVALYDLDQQDEWARIHADEPGFTQYGVHMGKAPFRPNGHGFGPWIIEKMRKVWESD